MKLPLEINLVVQMVDKGRWMMKDDVASYISEIKSLMTDPNFYPHYTISPIQVKETHISLVFLTGGYAYKVKKPVSFGDILDFSTLKRRKHFCYEEIRLNSRLSPELYLGVVGLTEDGLVEDALNENEIFEYAVKMKQLPPDSTLFDRLTRGESVSVDVIREIADIVARFHEKAERLPQYGRYEVIFEKNDENFRTTAQYMEINEEYKNKIYHWMELHRQLLEKE